VLVPEGYTAVLGGLFRDDTERARSQVPFFGDIPLLGAAFRGNDDNLNREEIIFLIRAVVMEPQILVEQGRRGEEFQEAVRVGSRLGLLPWSRERRSSRLNMKAETLARDGQTEDALWYLSRSLQLNPAQPEAVRLRQQMMTRSDWWPTRSILERIIDGELDAGFRQHPVFAPDEH
jgi:hypothetical protein